MGRAAEKGRGGAEGREKAGCQQNGPLCSQLPWPQLPARLPRLLDTGLPPSRCPWGELLTVGHSGDIPSSVLARQELFLRGPRSQT